MNTVKRFRTDERGGVAIMFGLAVIPLVGLVGAAIDYSRASIEKTRMQKAVDGTALTLSTRAAGLSDRQLTAEGQRIFRTMFAAAPQGTHKPVEIARVAEQIKVGVAGTLPTTLLRVVGIETIDVSAHSEVVWRGPSDTKYEISLVLDNTGSMRDVVDGKAKIDWLKQATTSFLTHLNRTAVNRDAIKVAIVPFDTQVRLDANKHRDASWLALAPADQGRWEGYVEDRGDDQKRSTYDTSDAAATPTDRNSLYPAVLGGRGGAELAPVQPLVSIKDGFRTLTNSVERMRGSGATNITIGAAWGMATLSNQAPFTEAAAPSSTLQKVMVIVTDGDNTKNRWDGTGQVNPRDRALINARTRMACANAKAKNITIMTVRLVEGDKDLLTECASVELDTNSPFYNGGAPLFFDVRRPADLERINIFIGEMIRGTRISA